MSFERGDIIQGQYRLDGLLGRGGMGAVYRATHVGLGETVALKVVQMPPGASLSGGQKSTFLKRFKREARVAFKLRHDNAVRVMDFGEADGTPYLVMEYLDGRPLDVELNGATPLRPVERIWELGRQLADVLVCMHRQSLVHRDLKPANVILLDGLAGDEAADTGSGERAVLVDFGLAYLADSETLGRVTQAGEAIGTPEYISPEQGRGDPTIGPPTDIYALGCMFFEMLTGRVPFDEGSPSEIVAKHMFVEPPSLADRLESVDEMAGQVPEAAVTMVESMLAKTAADRPEAEEVRDLMERLLEGQSTRRRGRPERFLEPRATRSVTAPETPQAKADLGHAETRNVSPSSRESVDGQNQPHQPKRENPRGPLLAIVGRCPEDWQLSLGSAGIRCVEIDEDTDIGADGPDAVFVPDATPERVDFFAARSSGPVLAGCDPSDLGTSTALLGSHAADVVTQPVEPEKLAAKVQRAIRRHRRRQS